MFNGDTGERSIGNAIHVALGWTRRCPEWPVVAQLVGWNRPEVFCGIDGVFSVPQVLTGKHSAKSRRRRECTGRDMVWRAGWRAPSVWCPGYGDLPFGPPVPDGGPAFGKWR